MTNISDEMISVDEAKAALRCMRLSGLSEEDSLESIDCFAERIRKVSTAMLVEDIIENQLSRTQSTFIKDFWYSGKNTTEIASEYEVSRANVYRTLSRASDTIRRLMTPLVEYHKNLIDIELVPIYLNEIMQICSARNSETDSFCSQLRNIRISYAITAQHLADSLKISLRELTEIESGRRIPTITTMMRYSALFGLEIKLEFTNGRGTYQCKTVLRS